MRDHPLREALNDELHARPPLRLATPATLSHQVFLAPEGEAEADRARLARFAEKLGQSGPARPARHLVVTLPGGFLLRWERHGEFQAFTLVRPRAPLPHEDPWSALVPEALALLEAAPGERLVAMHLRIETGIDSEPPRNELGAELVGARFGSSGARAFTDFLLHQDGPTGGAGGGFGRWLLQVPEGFDPGRLGRMAQRILEVETYRMAALLALPDARAAVSGLSAMEQRLATIVEHTAQGTDDDTKLLEELTALAAEAEADAARRRFRLAATAAYGTLVERRIADLEEARIPGFQPVSVFLDRRFRPALDTCAAVARRQEALLRGLANAASLLRTRVDVRLEQQNASLLATMGRRAAMQLRLSMAVEGFSTFAIAYYAVSLLKYAAEGLPGIGFRAPEWLGLVAVPVLAGAIWYSVRRLRRSLRARELD
jgi:uncharacterized membrane-anchored protein